MSPAHFAQAEFSTKIFFSADPSTRRESTGFQEANEPYRPDANKPSGDFGPCEDPWFGIALTGGLSAAVNKQARSIINR